MSEVQQCGHCHGQGCEPHETDDGRLIRGPYCVHCGGSGREPVECTWTLTDEGDQYTSTCGPDKYICMAPAGMTYCPYCSRKLSAVSFTSDRGAAK